MWLEAIFSRADLSELVGELLPATFRFGDDAWVALGEPSEVRLVPDVGLRVGCKAKLRWAVAGIPVPVTLHSLTVLLRPTIVPGAVSEALSFDLRLEHADLAGVPDFVDVKITERVNRAIAERGLRATWDFGETLARTIPMPERLEPIDALELSVAWGKVRITEEAMGLVLSFRARVARGGQIGRRPSPKPVAAPRPAPVETRARDARSSQVPIAIAAATVVGFVSGAVVAALGARLV